MTYDIVALCERAPAASTTLAAMRECGPSLRVTTIERGAFVQLCDDTDRPLVTIEGPRLVRVRGEAQRLLGIDADLPHPLWWVEARAARGEPEAAALARRFTVALLSVTGGTSWASR